MVTKKSLGEKIFDFLNACFMIFVIIVCVYPIYHVCMASFSSSDMLMAHTGILLKPLNFSLYAYEKVAENEMILTGFKNTLIVLVAGVFLNMLLSIIGAYFLSRRNVKWKMPIMFMILITMYFSGGLVPSYLTIKSLGLEDSLLALIIPTAINTYNLIIMRTGFDAIPNELEEAAKIDGAGHMRILFSVCVPVVKPTLAVVLLYYAVERWNSWFNASIYLKSRSLYPIQLVLREILILSDTGSMTSSTSTGDVEALSASIKYAVTMVATVPILCVYPFLQKFFEKGVMIGSIKG